MSQILEINTLLRIEVADDFDASSICAQDGVTGVPAVETNEPLEEGFCSAIVSDRPDFVHAIERVDLWVYNYCPVRVHPPTPIEEQTHDQNNSSKT